MIRGGSNCLLVCSFTPITYLVFFILFHSLTHSLAHFGRVEMKVELVSETTIILVRYSHEITILINCWAVAFLFFLLSAFGIGRVRFRITVLSIVRVRYGFTCARRVQFSPDVTPFWQLLVTTTRCIISSHSHTVLGLGYRVGSKEDFFIFQSS